MERKHKVLLWCVTIIVVVCAYLFQLEYRNIASEGMTLSSIVLAVYVAAMMGLSGSTLGKKLATMQSKNPEYTQLWVLRKYFRNAIVFAVLTIIVSSINLLLPQQPQEVTYCVYQLLSLLSIAIYAVNLVFMGLILKFMMNRQIWDV